uniref:YD repeat protein n=1 Tax=Solibacter usitatus (strain Ellin6076) TaxID=234267 RepID=Q01T13_SOLUE
MLRVAGEGACRDCAQTGFGGPADNRFVAYDALCKGAGCRDAGVPQVFVNAANLTLFVRITELAFGGPAPALALEQSFNQDDASGGALGTGWSFSLGDRIATETDGSLTLHRGSGRTDRFSTAVGSTALFAMTKTTDALALAADGTYTLTTPGSTTSRVFSADGRLLSILDGITVRVSLDYDGSGHLTAAHYRGKLINFATDSGGRITSIKDTTGRSVSFTYTDGRLSQQTNADGQATTYSYDAAGNLTAITYAGGKTAITYGGDAGFTAVATVTTPDGAVRQYDTPRTPSEIRVIDGNGDPMFYTSTALGLLLSSTDPAGNTTTYAYDASGNRTQAANAAGETINFSYDSSGNLTAITDSGNNRWSADYSNGSLAHITDPNKNVWTLKYDAGGNLIGVTNPLSGATSATRNAAGQVTSVADPLGNKSQYQYNTDGLISAFTDGLNNRWTYDYDGAARTATKTDPAGNALKVTYTAGNRIASLSAGTTQSNFDYSGIQRDSQNRITSYTDTFGNKLTYTYDAAGQMNSLTLPGGKTVSYQYDHLHRLSKVSDWQGNFAFYSYDTAGFPVSLSVSGGPVTIYQYDGARNLRAIVSTGPDGTPVAAYRYTVDGNGNRTTVSALEPNTSTFALPAYTLAYDADNHPVSRSDGQTYKYDTSARLTTVQGSRNLTLAYDAFGRLQGVSGDATTTYGYDSMGLRVIRNDRHYVYDLASGSPRIVMETDGGGAPVAYYVYGLGLLWKVTADGTPYFYHFDGSGNVVAVSNATAGVVNQYRYDPLGRLIASHEGVENLFHARGAAGWADDGNGLLFTGSEYQLPELRLTLPAAADPTPPIPDLRPAFGGAGACFFEGVANCAAGSARRDR